MSRFKTSNNMAIILGYSIVVIITAALFGMFVNRQYHFIMYLALAATFIIYIFFVRSKVAASIEMMFLKGNIDELLEYYNKTIRMVPRAKFMRSYSRSLAFSLFGKFPEAKAEIEKMHTSGKAPMFEGMRQNAIALSYYLERKDYEAGLLCSKNARDLAEVGKAVPGRKTAANTYDAYVEIGMILNGKADEKIIESLQNRFRSSLFLLKLPIAWALARYYRGLDQDKFNEYDEFLKRNAPSCRPLHEYS